MDSTFLTGLVLGAVLGVVLDLFARPVQRLLDRRLETRTTARSERLRAELAADSSRLRDFLVLQIFETTLIGALVSIVTGLFYGVQPLLNYPRWMQPFGQIAPIVGAILILRIASDAITVARSVEPELMGSRREA
jgi:hypothetical protein